MTAMLILAGLLLFILSWGWMVVKAFLYKPFWGLAVVFPPLLIVFIFLHGRRAILPVIALTFSVGVIGYGGYQLATEQPERWQKLMAGQWFTSPIQQQMLSAEQVQGTVFGQRFVAQHAEFDGKVISLRENPADEFASEIQINLASRPQLTLNSGLFVDVLPDDVHEVPSIEINWYSYELGQRQSTLVTSDYTLRLALNSQPPNELVGELYLSLVKAQNTTVSGTLEVKSNQLRYQGRQVDLSYDHPETLEYLIQQHSRQTLERPELVFERTSEIELFSVPLTVTGMLHFDGQKVPATFVLSKQQDWHIVESNLATIARHNPAERPETKPPQVQEFSLALLEANVERFLNQTMSIETIAGYKFVGRFQGTNAEGGLVFQRTMHKGGEVKLQLQPEEVKHISWQR